LDTAAVLCWQQAAAQRAKVLLFLFLMSAFRVSDCWCTGKMCLQVSIDACKGSHCVVLHEMQNVGAWCGMLVLLVMHDHGSGVHLFMADCAGLSSAA
jgi:hypothetical protein